MIAGIVIAIGFGLSIVGGCGAMINASEHYPDRKMVTLFSILFLLGLGMVGGGIGATS